jgi:molecular chaperone GrpE
MQDDTRSAVADNSESAASSPDESANPVSSPEQERDQLAQQKAELQDRYIRLQAEFENFRRRAERERMEFAQYAGMEVVRALLPTIDDFERALKIANDAGTADDEFVKGIQLIYNKLIETLQKQGVEPIAAESAKFDPHAHHAVQRVESDEAGDGDILEVYQRGYNFKGKLLRPAMVKVAVKA